MADWDKPDLGSAKTEFHGEVRAVAINAAVMDYTGDSNIPTGAMQWNDTSKAFERYSGSAFVAAADWEAFDTVTVTPSAGTFTPSSVLGIIQKFNNTAIIEMNLAGTQSVASAATLTVTTTGPIVPNHRSGLGLTVVSFCAQHSYSSGAYLLGVGQILSTGNAIVLRLGALTDFLTGTHQYNFTVSYPI